MDKESRKAKLTDFIRTERLKLISYVQSLINDASERDGEDIVQDVLLNIFDMADVSRPIDNLASYIYQSLRNRVIDILRKKNNYETISYDEINYADNSSLDNVLYDKRYNTALEFEKKDVRDNIFSVIDSLENEYKEIIYLTEFEGKSFKEISDEFDIPIGTLLSRKSRALKKIKEKLNPITIGE
jgi:RNA polymerase sigma factor (sigma-70 family)